MLCWWAGINSSGDARPPVLAAPEAPLKQPQSHTWLPASLRRRSRRLFSLRMWLSSLAWAAGPLAGAGKAIQAATAAIGPLLRCGPPQATRASPAGLQTRRPRRSPSGMWRATASNPHRLASFSTIHRTCRSRLEWGVVGEALGRGRGVCLGALPGPPPCARPPMQAATMRRRRRRRAPWRGTCSWSPRPTAGSPPGSGAGSAPGRRPAGAATPPVGGRGRAQRGRASDSTGSGAGAGQGRAAQKGVLRMGSKNVAGYRSLGSVAAALRNVASHAGAVGAARRAAAASAAGSGVGSGRAIGG